MPTSTRFAVTVHILSILALHDRQPVRSEYLAASVCTNPAVIRRLLCKLSDAGLTSSQLGYGGGTMLAKPADQITLLDIFHLVEDPNIFEMHRTKPNENCSIGRNIQEILLQSTTKAQQVLEDELAKTTIAQVSKEIQKLSKQQN
ncbi:MAG: Rrf2 family transcriptional regulator [Alkalinema sp. RU_4_3]|nr:Rrf2 family transcriptional regulator [Alkalinema sp. RU_4_3]